MTTEDIEKENGAEIHQEIEGEIQEDDDDIVLLESEYDMDTVVELEKRIKGSFKKNILLLILCIYYLSTQRRIIS